MGLWARTGRLTGAGSSRGWAGAVALAGALLALLGPAAGVAFAGQAAAISATEGEQFSGVVDTVSCGSAGRIQKPAIDWGDNTGTSTGTVSDNGGGSCSISGMHTYGEEGSYATTVTYTSTGSFTDTGSASVADAQPKASGGSGLSGTAGSMTSGVVATFSDPAPESLSSYSATIDWGDGSSSPGSIGSGFTVSGSHTYAYGGTYPVTVTIHDEGGAVTAAQTAATVSGCSGAGPSQPSSPFNPPAVGLNARYVEALFHDLLGRVPSGGELTAFTAALAHGATRDQLALSILQSAEYRQDLVGQLYSAYLGSAPDAASASFFTGLLQAGASDEALGADILGSGAFFSGPGGGSNNGFLAALYCRTLFRAVDHSTQAADNNLLGSGTTRTAIASDLLGSIEYLSHRVGSFYLRFLRRQPSPAELQFYVNLIHGGGSDEQVIASIVSSAEYYGLFNPTVKAVTTASAQGTIHTTIDKRAKLTLTVLHVLHGAQDAAVRPVLAPRTRRVGVVNFGIHRKGRVTLHWNRKVRRHRLAAGTYVLILRGYRGRKLIFTSDALPFRVH